MLELPNATTIEGNTVRWGKIGHGPPLVAIHGTPFSSQVWRRIVPQLADLRTIYYFDLVGYGQSEMRTGQDVSLAVQNGVLASSSRVGASTVLMFSPMISAGRRRFAPII